VCVSIFVFPFSLYWTCVDRKEVGSQNHTHSSTLGPILMLWRGMDQWESKLWKIAHRSDFILIDAVGLQIIEPQKEKHTVARRVLRTAAHFHRKNSSKVGTIWDKPPPPPDTHTHTHRSGRPDVTNLPM
jgi:hypothetical protein